MRKLVCGLLAVAVVAMPLSGSFAHEGYYGHRYYKPKVVKKDPPPSQRGNNATGQWAVACGIASAASLMIGTGINAARENKKERRQLTITEAAWYASACPVFLPFALIAQATCPDNKATYRIATLAYRYLHRNPASDQSAFTVAYGEACRTGQLSRETLAKLNALVSG
jgi:hypothetical protein